MAWLSVSADSKGLICTKIVQNLGVLGTAHSKRLSRYGEELWRKKNPQVGDSKGAIGAKTKTPPTDRRRNFVQGKA